MRCDLWTKVAVCCCVFLNRQVYHSWSFVSLPPCAHTDLYVYLYIYNIYNKHMIFGSMILQHILNECSWATSLQLVELDKAVTTMSSHAILIVRYHTRNFGSSRSARVSRVFPKYHSDKSPKKNKKMEPYRKYHTLIIYLSHHIRSKSVGKNQLLYIPLWLFTTGISPKGPPPWPRRGVSWSKGHRVLATFGAGGWVVEMGQWRRKWSDEPTEMGILHSMDWLI